MASAKSQNPHAPSPVKSRDAMARLNCRISAPVKGRAEAAAALLGQSMTGFTEAALADKAQAVLERQERIVLSERDFARFVALTQGPPPPTPALSAAMEEYRRLQAEHPASNL